MRPLRCLVAATLNAALVLASTAARSECDLTKPAEPTASRFEIHNDIVYDKRNDLTWMRCSYGQAWTDTSGCSGSAKLVDWDGAMALHPEGNAAWRLPQRDELQGIVDHRCKRPAINEAVFPDTPSIQYWTSTPSGPSFAWIIFLRTGSPTWTYNKTTPFAVRLVHNGR